MPKHIGDDVFDIVRHDKIEALNGRERLGATQQRHGGARTAAQNNVVMFARGCDQSAQCSG